MHKNLKLALSFATLAACLFSFEPATAASARGRKALAESFELPTPKRLTTFNHPVIYSSPDVYAKRVGGKTIVRQTLIIKWGLHVFEVAEGLYQCTGAASEGYDCEWVDHTRIATFSSCDIRGAKPKCVGKLAGNSGPTEDIDIDWAPDSTNEPTRRVPDEWSEFPERHHDPENPIP